MQPRMDSTPTAQNVADARGRPVPGVELFAALCVLLVAGCLFGVLFNRDRTLSHSIGYNLHGAERVLSGEVPYRDFHTLYPPATVYLNAWLFGLFGVSMYVALAAVGAFKAATTLVIYLCARKVTSLGGALGAAVFSLVWLRPNGPFKAVPMHYGAFLLALSTLLILKYGKEQQSRWLLAAGGALGILALFKHNIGAYALVGFFVLVVLSGRKGPGPFFRRGSGQGWGQDWRQGWEWRRGLLLLAGSLIPLAPVCAYMQTRDALLPMIKTLAFGPGEFLIGRLAGLPSPAAALVFIAVECGAVFAARRLRTKPGVSSPLVALSLVIAVSFALAVRQSWTDGLIFYAPVIVIALGFVAVRWSRAASANWFGVMALTIAAAAAFMETFPRFAREQAVAAMPFAALLLVCLLSAFRSDHYFWLGGEWRTRAVAFILPLTIFLMGARLSYVTYFSAPFQFRSDTEPMIERARRVFYPAEEAREIEEVVAWIQQRVPEGGYFFPESYTGSSYLFLAARRNPSGAQFWGGVGVSDAERAETVRAIEEKQVNLIVASDKDLAAEKYQPMRRYIEEHFHETRRIGDVVILER
jgi:hypothetical protein